MRLDEIISRKARNALRQKRAQKTKTDDPYLMGDEARHQGKSKNDNPFPEDSENHIDWNQGFEEAKV